MFWKPGEAPAKWATWLHIYDEFDLIASNFRSYYCSLRWKATAFFHRDRLDCFTESSSQNKLVPNLETFQLKYPCVVCMIDSLCLFLSYGHSPHTKSLSLSFVTVVPVKWAGVAHVMSSNFLSSNQAFNQRALQSQWSPLPLVLAALGFRDTR